MGGTKLPAPAGFFQQAVYAWQTQAILAQAPSTQWSTERFVVYYDGESSADARLVASVGEQLLDRVLRDFRVELDPEEKVTVIIKNDRQSLNDALGLDANHSVLGAYYHGVIWVLAPSAWVPEAPAGLTPEQAVQWRNDYFRREGPMAHEFVHLALDRRTGGRIPAWLNEGLAQYEEYTLHGWEWVEERNRLDQPLYTLHQLSESFDLLENQALAYRQSYLFIHFLVDELGEESIEQLLVGLRAGRSDRQILQQMFEQNWHQIEHRYNQWLKTEVMDAWPSVYSSLTMNAP